MFGLWGLLGKTVAICPDAHLGRGDQAINVLEILKSISGEDTVEVHRKNLPSISARLGVRFTLALNELPKFGDYDPSGFSITDKIEDGLRRYAPIAEVHISRVAVTPEQIHRWNLPSKPPKATNARAKDFDGNTVELDAIHPDDLRDLVRDCIEQHIDSGRLARLQQVEAAERETLEAIIDRNEGTLA